MIDVIYIPTLDRDNQITYNSLPDKYKKKVIFVKDRIGIHKVRKKIAYDAGKVNFAVFDDDLFFKRRYVNWRELNCKSKENFTEKDFDDMFNTIDSWLNDGIIQCGLRDSNAFPKGVEYIENGPIFRAMFFNGSLLNNIIDDIDWDLVKVGEDTNLILEFLSRGYKNRISDTFLYFAKEYGDVGGCSNYRDEELNYQEHIKLMNKWPMFVTQMENSKINNWRRFKVSWSKAYKFSQQGKLDI